VSAAFLQVDYELQNPSFLVVRRDRRSDVEASLQYALAEALTVRLGASWTEQRSNVPIYEFERLELWLALRREFR
jgi:hypothetical protein